MAHPMSVHATDGGTPIRDTCNRDDDNVHEVAQDYDDDNIDGAMDCDEVTVNEAK